MMTSRVTGGLTLTTATTGGPGSHLAPSSPAIPGSCPDRLPTATVCGLPVSDLARGRPVWEVDCVACLLGSTSYWQMPSWA